MSGKEVTFTFELVPADMKFLAFLNGELNKSAKYYSSLANVSKGDCVTLNSKFGSTSDCKWKPWSYTVRLNIAKQVESFKAKLPTNLAASTTRAEATQFIIRKKSRQECEPLIRKLCDKEVAEPLHLKNNRVQHLHTMLLDLAISLSNLPEKITSLSQLSPASGMSRYMKALECEKSWMFEEAALRRSRLYVQTDWKGFNTHFAWVYVPHEYHQAGFR